jgi:hypothetical protein
LSGKNIQHYFIIVNNFECVFTTTKQGCSPLPMLVYNTLEKEKMEIHHGALELDLELWRLSQ